MATKTFTTGEVLTAADTNTYLANSGLVYITTATATSGTTLNISNCFSTTYDNYRVLVASYRAVTAAGLTVQLGTGTATASGYYWGGVYLSAYTASPTLNTHGNANTTAFETAIIGEASTDGSGLLDIFSPNLARQTGIVNLGVDGRTGGAPRQTYTGFQNSATQFTSLHLNCGGTFTNVVVTVYGYRKA